MTARFRNWFRKRNAEPAVSESQPHGEVQTVSLVLEEEPNHAVDRPAVRERQPPKKSWGWSPGLVRAMERKLEQEPWFPKTMADVDDCVKAHKEFFYQVENGQLGPYGFWEWEQWYRVWRQRRECERSSATNSSNETAASLERSEQEVRVPDDVLNRMRKEAEEEREALRKALCSYKAGNVRAAGKEMREFYRKRKLERRNPPATENLDETKRKEYLRTVD